jgi:hypothetical protein
VRGDPVNHQCSAPVHPPPGSERSPDASRRIPARPLLDC